jgi:hypothetical protein
LMDRPKILNINRAWHISQQISMAHVCRMTCNRCNSVFAAIREFPDPYKFCPLCDVTTDSTGRQKWRKLNLYTGHQKMKRHKKPRVDPVGPNVKGHL